MASISPPSVSIVVPCYLGTPHQAELLAETLETVAQQQYPNCETIVIDDGSPIDPSPIALRFPGTRCLRQENAGSALARNTGIAASRGDYLVFLDADDHLLPHALEAGLAALAARPECGFAVGRREEMTFAGEPVGWGVASLPEEPQIYRILLGFEWYIIPPSSAMFRRQVVERVGGFQNPWGADDLDFYLRVARQTPVVCHDHAVTRYRRYSASSSRDGERMLRSVREVYRRQLPFVKGHEDLRRAYQKGLSTLTDIFRDCLAENFQDRAARSDWLRASRAARMLLWESPSRLFTELQRLATGTQGALPARI